MTREEFEVLQSDLQQSGKSVKDYLHDAGVSYSTYNYWRKKLMEKASPKPELGPHHFYPAFRFCIYRCHTLWCNPSVPQRSPCPLRHRHGCARDLRFAPFAN